MQGGRAKVKKKVRWSDGRAKKCKLVEKKLNEKMQGGGAKVKKKSTMVEQKNVRWSSKKM
jgi:hypothetical protein